MEFDITAFTNTLKLAETGDIGLCSLWDLTEFREPLI